MKSFDIKTKIYFGDQANRIGADYIVTRNIRDFNDSKVPALKPSELLERI